MIDHRGSSIFEIWDEPMAAACNSALKFKGFDAGIITGLDDIEAIARRCVLFRYDNKLYAGADVSSLHDIRSHATELPSLAAKCLGKYLEFVGGGISSSADLWDKVPKELGEDKDNRRILRYISDETCGYDTFLKAICNSNDSGSNSMSKTHLARLYNVWCVTSKAIYGTQYKIIDYIPGQASKGNQSAYNGFIKFCKLSFKEKKVKCSYTHHVVACLLEFNLNTLGLELVVPMEETDV